MGKFWLPLTLIVIALLTSWEALRSLNARLIEDEMESSLVACNLAVSRAEGIYSEIAEAGLPLDRKSGSDHLESLRKGIQAFKEMAGLA